MTRASALFSLAEAPVHSVTFCLKLLNSLLLCFESLLYLLEIIEEGTTSLTAIIISRLFIAEGMFFIHQKALNSSLNT